MAIGTIDKDVFTDIANAIRVQNGGTDTYLPSEMAAAVLALDGTREGAPFQAAGTSGTGVISDSVFDAIADAIRAQNGLSETYKPGEMAPAILALIWDVGVKMRAILLADGTLEFNYRDGRSSDVPGAVILDAWEVDAAGYSSAGARPWDDVKLDVTRVVFDSDFSQGGLTNASYFFNGFLNLVEITGFEEMQGVGSFNQTFSGCASLETIYATEWAPTSSPTGSLAFYSCGRLVGGGGFVPDTMANISHLALGEDGVLTDPAADTRDWFYCYQYGDGELVFTASASPESGRTLVTSCRLCAQARYDSVGYQSWYDTRDDLDTVTIAADMATFDHVNMDYWFYGHTAITSVNGLSNLRGTREMRYAFASCLSLTSIDLSGFDESSLEDVFYCFSGCSALTTIWADADWALPSGCTGSQAFYQCQALVGGAGTTFATSRTSAMYMRIDGGVAAPGYLTVKETA